MSQIINLFFIIAGAITVVVGLVKFGETPVFFLAIPIGIALVVFAYREDQRREKRIADKRHAEIARRIAELTKAPWGAHQTLEIQRNSWVVIPILLLGSFSVLLLKTGTSDIETHWFPVSIGLLLLVFCVIALLNIFANFGKPAFELRRDAFATPTYGRISWRDVTGIDLQKRSTRTTTIYTLCFRVENYPQVAIGRHWIERLFAFFRLGASRSGILVVSLLGAKEKPETIYAVARFLWKEATGRDYDWSPLRSEALNEAFKRIGRTIPAHHSDPDALKQALLERPQETLAEIDQFNKEFKKDTDLIKDLSSAEAKHRLARAKWMIAAPVIVFLLFLAWRWLTRP